MIGQTEEMIRVALAPDTGGGGGKGDQGGLAVSTTEDNKLLVQRFFDELLNRGRLARAEEFVTGDFTTHGTPPGTPPGLEGVRALAIERRAAFPDLRYVIEDLIAEEDRVVARVTCRGTHRGPFGGVAPTGARIAQEQIHIVRFAGGKGAEHWAVRDDLGLLRQLGVTPTQETQPRMRDGDGEGDGEMDERHGVPRG